MGTIGIPPSMPPEQPVSAADWNRDVVESDIREPGDAGISMRAIRLGRILDRLSPGTFHIRLIKSDYGAWAVEIYRLDLLQEIALPRRMTFAPE